MSDPLNNDLSGPELADPTPPPDLDSTAERKRRRRGGLLDLTLMLLLIYGAYAKTPCGTLPVWALKKVQGKPTPDLLATFSGRETAAPVDLPKLTGTSYLASEKFPGVVENAAKSAKIDPELLVTWMLANGQTCEDAECRLEAPRHLPLFIDNFQPGTKATLAQIAEGIASASRELNTGPEAGVEALYVGKAFTARAIEQARASGIKRPADVEQHADFYTPSTRRGDLQKVIRILALHRLRTLAWPTEAKRRITSPFGVRIHPISGKRRFHNGTDIGAPTGDPLYAAQRGVIKRVGKDSISGNWIKIDHGFDLQTTYCHMNSVSVETNEVVDRKQLVGEVGATGRVTGAHLHYILRIEGKSVDSEMYGESPSRKIADGEETPKPRVPKALQDQKKGDAGPDPGTSDK